MEILLNFQDDFWKNLRKITGSSNNFIEKLQRNPKEILEIFGALSKICPGAFQSVMALSTPMPTLKFFGKF